MLKRANQPIPRIEDLQGFIQKPLSDDEKIPITQMLYNKLISSSPPDISDDNDVQALFKIGEPLDHDRVVPILYAIRSKPLNVAGTKNSFIHLWDTNIRCIIETLELSGSNNRNTSQHTETRPDFFFILSEKCPFRGEEKGPENSEDPKDELRVKLVWAYDPAPYVLGRPMAFHSPISNIFFNRLLLQRGEDDSRRYRSTSFA
jgi:hypothetical protein